MRQDKGGTRDWYAKYYEKHGQQRNDLVANPEVLFQYLALESSVISALRKTVLDREKSKILDVGCGAGDSLIRFLNLGFRAENLFGIDIIEDRIALAKAKLPHLNFFCGSAEAMPYEACSFDLAMESTMFVQVTDRQAAQAIAEEMLRVVRPEGYILLVDWRYSKPRSTDYLGLSRRRIKDMFSVGSKSRLICQRSGALVPFIGRPISKYIHPVYFPVRALFPFLTGQKSTLLKRI